MSGSNPYDQDPYADDFSEPVAQTPPADPLPPTHANTPSTPAPAAPATPPTHAAPRPPYIPGEIAATTVQCSGCGYNLTGVTIGGVCPECGMDVGQSIMTGATQATSSLAVSSMVLGIIAVFPACIPFVGIALPLIGLPMGIVSLNQYKRNQFTPGSKGMAIAGVATNGVALLIQLGMLIMVFT
ncbi:MAG: DUF4190 domain-containing protein [Phycisphaerales bacterium JB063]